MASLSIRGLTKRYGDFTALGDVSLEIRSGEFMTLNDVADELTDRLTSIFLRDAEGRRPSTPRNGALTNDPHLRDHVLFHEFFDGDDGCGLGASHQTGWTALVAKLLQPRRPLR